MSAGTSDPIRVLHVDDDPGFLSLTRKAIHREYDDVEIVSVESGEAALRRLEDVDCVVADYGMPDMNGLELVEAVRALDATLPLVLFTGKGSESVAVDALSAGVTDYLPKRPDLDQFHLLVNRVRQVVDAARRGRTLVDERDRFVALFENIPEPTVAYELRDGMEPYITDVNPAFEDIFGYAAPGVLDEPLDELIVPEDREAEASALNQRVADGGALDAEVTRLAVDGTRQFLLRDVPVERENGNHVGYAIYTDITEQRTRERQLRESRAKLERQNERLEAFAGVVSHDLRNPLAVALTNAELALDMGELTRVEKVIDALGRMDELVQDLLALAQHGTAVQSLDLCDVNSLAVRAWNAVETTGAELDVVAAGSIRVDESRAQQLFENLFRNAIEHGEARRVTVGFCGDDCVFVEDDGSGIHDSVRDRVFEHGISVQSDGSGFGLAIVASIADAHDWAVDVVDSGTGGARFELTGVTVVRKN
ncbi:response regulator [Haloarchaeobius sp. TZWWS8]|uniref:response regulator n=1 Tax=Haloarchaeobius sp. TZWWS8 TaxID=3446121 RepID=UPI003EB7E0C2